MIEKRQSTRQLLIKIPNYPCLYRHSVNDTYYGQKMFGGKRKEHSLATTDRKIAERKLKAWIADLDKTDSEAEKTTLSQLIERFVLVRQGKSDSTKTTEQGIINNLKADWKHNFDIRVSRIRPVERRARLHGVAQRLVGDDQARRDGPGVRRSSGARRLQHPPGGAAVLRYPWPVGAEAGRRREGDRAGLIWRAGSVSDRSVYSPRLGMTQA